jgi:hypothetical protein
MKLRVRDAPLGRIWSISVYDEKGFFAQSDLDSYSINDVTAKRMPTGRTRPNSFAAPRRRATAW